MTDKRLTAHTLLPAQPGSGTDPVLLGPDDEVPDWAVPMIGAHLWEGGVHPNDEDGDGQADRGEGEEPTRAGRGSGKDAWIAFAHEKGHGDLAEGKTRDEIVQALVDAGVIEA